MRRVRISLALVAPAFLSACGYIHFGKLPEGATSASDAAMSAAYSNLTTEHKILKQELALVRKQGDALRLALERGDTVPNSGANDIAAQLTETTRELASLRASYAKLQTEKGSTAVEAAASGSAAKRDLEEKLATALRTSTQLQEENARLRLQVDRAASENVALAEQLKNSLVQAERAQGTIGELNTDLLAQKVARVRAEQASEALRAQLSTVMAHRSPATTTQGGADPIAVAVTSLQIAKAPPADSSPTAELRMNTAHLRPENMEDKIAVSPRVHVVNAGDTLESIARQYLGAPDRWTAIYEANSTQLSNGQPMRAGMELQIPEK